MHVKSLPPCLTPVSPFVYAKHYYFTDGAVMDTLDFQCSGYSETDSEHTMGQLGLNLPPQGIGWDQSFVFPLVWHLEMGRAEATSCLTRTFPIFLIQPLQPKSLPYYLHIHHTHTHNTHTV